MEEVSDFFVGSFFLLIFVHFFVLDGSGASEYFDPKERSKERKKNVEANKTDDKRTNAMALLKAKREGKQKRGKFFFIAVNALPV